MVKFCNRCQSDTVRYANGRCKECSKAWTAAYRERNPEKEKLRSEEWRNEHREKSRVKMAKWRKNNPEKAQKRNPVIYAAWFVDNKERVKATNLAWRAANIDKMRAADSARYKANSEKRRAQSKAWATANPEACRIIKQNRNARKLGNGGNLSKGLSAKLLKLQQGRCACCGEHLGDNFHLDHIVPLVLGGANEDWNIQLLRAKCNMEKHTSDPIDFMQRKGMLL